MKNNKNLIGIIAATSIMLLFASCNSGTTETSAMEPEEEATVETTVEPTPTPEPTNTPTPTSEPMPIPEVIDQTLEDVVDVLYQALIDEGLNGDWDDAIYYWDYSDADDLRDFERGFIRRCVIMGGVNGGPGTDVISHTTISIIVTELDEESEAYHELYSNEPIIYYEQDLRNGEYIESTFSFDAYNGQYLLQIYCFDYDTAGDELDEWHDGAQTICDIFSNLG